MILVRITLATLDTSVQNQTTILTFEAIGMIILAHGPEPGGGGLPLAGHNGPFASSTTIGLLLGIILRAVDGLLLVHNKLIVRQILVANHASETFWMKGRRVGAHHVSTDLLATLGTVVRFGLVVGLAIVFLVEGEARANDGFTTIGALLGPQFVIPFANRLTLKSEVLAS